MEQNSDLETTEQVEIFYQQDKAQIDVQISTAKAYPRVIKRCLEDAIAIATMDKETAATCTYSLPRGGKTLTGPSVHLAKILAQVWGNMRIEAKVVAVDMKHVISEAICFDLEKNIAIKTQVKRSIINKTGGRFNDDMITVTGNAANSIALRNAILSVIPRAVVDRVYNEARKTITGDLSDATKLLKKRKEVFEKLQTTYEVTEKEILGVVGKASVDHITPDDLMVLIGIGTAIKDGETSVDQAFKRIIVKPEQNKEAERINLLLSDCKTVEEVEAIQKQAPEFPESLFDQRKNELSK
jgi:hypothetical protein